VTAFVLSIIVTLLLTGIVIYEGYRRPPGSRLTWGEGFVAGFFIFFLFLMVYGVVPDRWLRWADGELKWRSDKIGIPLGPFYTPLHNLLGIGTKGVLAPNGIKFFDRGKVTITAQDVRDVLATLIYGVGLAGHIVMWRWWQQRGKKPAVAVEKVSAYGRPLVRSS